MQIIRWANAALIAAGANVTLPVTAPRLATVLGAEITRPSQGLADHLADAVILGVDDHLAAAVALGVTEHLANLVIGAIDPHTAAEMATAMGAHQDTEVVDAILAHPVHAHDLLIQAVVSAEDYGASGALNDIQSAGNQLVPGAQAQGGVQDIAAAQAHADGTNPLNHVDNTAPLAHVASGNPVNHVASINVDHLNGVAVEHLGANPIQAVIATYEDADTITLDENLLAGDLLTLRYLEVGDAIPVS